MTMLIALVLVIIEFLTTGVWTPVLGMAAPPDILFTLATF